MAVVDLAVGEVGCACDDGDVVPFFTHSLACSSVRVAGALTSGGKLSVRNKIRLVDIAEQDVDFVDNGIGDDHTCRQGVVTLGTFVLAQSDVGASGFGRLECDSQVVAQQDFAFIGFDCLQAWMKMQFADSGFLQRPLGRTWSMMASPPSPTDS